MRNSFHFPISMVLTVMAMFLLSASTIVYGDVPSTVNFQGYLTDSAGEPVADGTYTMNFYLFDAPTGGSQLWNPNSGEQQTVTVTGGIYNVQLGAVQPLSSSVFKGGAAWLEVEVEGEILSPRQQVTSTAFALKAGDSDTLEGNDISDLDARYVQEGQSGAVDSNMIADNTIGAADLGADSVGSSEIATNGVTSSEVLDNSLTSADLAADSVGNSELAPNSVGSAEIINGAITASDMQDGAARAEILDDDGVGSGLDADFLDGLSSSYFMSAGTDNWVNTTGDTMTGMLTTNTTGRGILVDANPIAGNLVGVSIDADQSSANNYSTYGLQVDTDSDAPTATTYGIHSSGNGNDYSYGLYGAGRSNNNIAYGVYGRASAPTTTSDYHVGVGAYSYVPEGSTASSYGFRSTAYQHGTGQLTGASNNAWHYGTDGTTYGTYSLAYGSDNGTTYGIYAAGLNSPTTYGIYAVASGGTDNYAGFFRGDLVVDSGSDAALAFILEPDGYSNNPELAMYDDDNEMKVQIIARETSTTEGAQIKMWDEDGTNTIELDAEYADNGGGYLALRNGDGVTTITLDSDYSGDGRIITEELQITGGSDLSEQFDVRGAKDDIAPGMVVSIDPDRPGQLMLSRIAYDNKVAGIISGAGGIKTGMMMGQQGTRADGQHPVALSGRVYCWADASAGSIRPGDLLTTSDIPGHAMKVTDHVNAIGAMLGKAMTSLEEGRGLVLVLVSLQ